MHARAMPLADPPKNLLRWFNAVAAVVFTVSVAVCAAEPVMVIEDGMLHMAGWLAATGLIEQLRLIAPVNPPDGVNVMVDVFPVVAPGTTVTAVPVIEKLARLITYAALATALSE
jgi:hypothetical protein